VIIEVIETRLLGERAESEETEASAGNSSALSASTLVRR
jgi:hypothetical protein